MEGRKGDSGKLRYDLIPPHALERLAEVYTLGARKYGDHNWRKGMAWGRVYAAMMRHLQAWAAGRTVDPDDGQHPLASVAWCCFTLMEYERLGVGVDNIREEAHPASTVVIATGPGGEQIHAEPPTEEEWEAFHRVLGR